MRRCSWFQLGTSADFRCISGSRVAAAMANNLLSRSPHPSHVGGRMGRLSYRKVVSMGGTVAALVLVGAAAHAQKVNAWVITAQVKSRMGTSATDPEGPLNSAVLHITKAGNVERLEIGPNPNAGQWESGPNVPPGIVYFTTVSDTGVVVTVADSNQKTYMTMNVHEPPTFPPGAPTIPKEAIPVITVSNVGVTVDSLGPGPVTLGHPTVRYRQTQHVTVQTDIGTSMTTILRLRSAAEVTIATGIPDAPRVTGFGIEQIVGGGEMMAVWSDLAAAMRTATAKYPRGIVVHVEGVDSMPMGGLKVVKLDVEKIEQSQVDATMLAPPAAYTKGPSFPGMGMPFGMMGMSPGFP